MMYFTEWGNARVIAGLLSIEYRYEYWNWLRQNSLLVLYFMKAIILLEAFSIDSFDLLNSKCLRYFARL